LGRDAELQPPSVVLRQRLRPSEDAHRAQPCAVDPLTPAEAGRYVVATPIGNLEDITLRALRVLRAADAVYCEDTRHTGRLLSYYGIKTKLLSSHAHNESTRVEGMLARVRSGGLLAVVSDAGMPMVSDPGGVLVAAAVQAGVRVVRATPPPASLLTATLHPPQPSLASPHDR
jgi:16S rRNA (cytidine1402-2'-O)-methyltransferase